MYRELEKLQDEVVQSKLTMDEKQKVGVVIGNSV